MPAGGARELRFGPDLYWSIRRRELAHVSKLLQDSVGEVQRHQDALLKLSDTAKLHEPDWVEAQTAAMHALRRARTNRTRLRRMVAGIRDTLRIRTNIAEAMPSDFPELLDKASMTLDYLEAHGY